MGRRAGSFMSVNKGQRCNYLEAGAFMKTCVLLFSQHSDRVSKPEKSSYSFTGAQWTVSFTNERNVITLCFLKGKGVATSTSGLRDQTSQALESAGTRRPVAGRHRLSQISHGYFWGNLASVTQAPVSVNRYGNKNMKPWYAAMELMLLKHGLRFLC